MVAHAHLLVYIATPTRPQEETKALLAEHLALEAAAAAAAKAGPAGIGDIDTDDDADPVQVRGMGRSREPGPELGGRGLAFGAGKTSRPWRRLGACPWACHARHERCHAGAQQGLDALARPMQKPLPSRTCTVRAAWLLHAAPAP